MHPSLFAAAIREDHVEAMKEFNQPENPEIPPGPAGYSHIVQVNSVAFVYRSPPGPGDASVN